MGRRWKLLIIIGLSVALIDQWTKFLAVKHLTPSMETLQSVGAQVSSFYNDIKGPCTNVPSTRCPTVQVIDGFWSWRYAENKGAAWSLFARAGDAFRVPFLVGVSILAVFFIVSFVRKLEEHQKMLLYALCLICGGAIGNLIDRIYLGYVIDFIDWYVGNSHWPTFNIADSAISVGVGLIGLNMVLDHFKGKKPAEATA